MIAGPDVSPRPAAPDRPLWRRFLALPSTRPGRRSVQLAAGFVALFVVNVTVSAFSTVAGPWRWIVRPVFGVGMLACGLAAGIVGTIAVIRKGERSWLAWLTILAGLMVLFFLLGEILVPH